MAIEALCNASDTPWAQPPKANCFYHYYTAPLHGTPKGNILGPWVSITFKGSGSQITVGNESSPNTNPKHVACIKSFECGSTDGLKVRCVIQDQQGGSFHKFMNNLLMDWACLKDPTNPGIIMRFNFGWTRSGCPNEYQPSGSPCYEAVVTQCEASYEGGKFTFEITGTDKVAICMDGSANGGYGGDGAEGISIKQALRELWIRSEAPNVANVQFLRLEGGRGVPCPFKHSGDKRSPTDASATGGSLEGPTGKWLVSGKNKIACSLDWLKPFPTDRNKGWMAVYNPSTPGGEVIFWEDGFPDCKAEGDGYFDERSIGTFLVNGSKDSPVIEFAPKINWPFAKLPAGAGGTLGSGGTINTLQTEGSSTPGRPDCPPQQKTNIPGAGQVYQTPVDENGRAILGKDSGKEAMKAQDKATKALRLASIHAIEADLTIVGDPAIVPLEEAAQKVCSIVFINPYFLAPRGYIGSNYGEDRPCGDWLVEPICNDVLSNKAWFIKSVTHRIEVGNFTTTLNLYLAGPGIDGDPNAPLGLWSGGWKPTNKC